MVSEWVLAFENSTLVQFLIVDEARSIIFAYHYLVDINTP